MLTENVSYFYDFSIDNRKDVRYNTNIHTEYMFGIFVWNICITPIIYLSREDSHLFQVVSDSKFVSVGVQSPTEINAPRGCAVIL